MAKKHIHKYYKGIISGTTPVWACGYPDCSHYMPEHMEKLIPGKATKCWGSDCDENTIMDARTMKLDKPLCTDCDPNYFELNETDMDKINKMFMERGK